jgi:hypothetical protein
MMPSHDSARRLKLHWYSKSNAKKIPVNRHALIP